MFYTYKFHQLKYITQFFHLTAPRSHFPDHGNWVGKKVLKAYGLFSMSGIYYLYMMPSYSVNILNRLFTAHTFVRTHVKFEFHNWWVTGRRSVWRNVPLIRFGDGLCLCYIPIYFCWGSFYVQPNIFGIFSPNKLTKMSKIMQTFCS